jgi:multiple sugar transport system permease protein
MANEAVKISRRDKWEQTRTVLTPYVFLLPFVVLFLTFGLFPIVYSFYISLHEWNGIRNMKFVGLQNYLVVLGDPLFWKSLLNTLGMLLIGSIPQHVFALAFAFILNQGFIKFKELFKGILFLPYITSTVAIAMFFNIFFGYHFGLANYLITLFDNVLPLGISLPIEWKQGFITWFTLSSLTIWKWTGWTSLIYFAGMQSIPNEIYEAARIDGASGKKIFFNITLPLLKPMILFATTITIIGGFQLFDEPMTMIGPGAMGNSDYVAMSSSVYIYMNAFMWGFWGRATAAAYLLFVLIAGFSVVNRKIQKEK